MRQAVHELMSQGSTVRRHAVPVAVMVVFEMVIDKPVAIVVIDKLLVVIESVVTGVGG